MAWNLSTPDWQARIREGRSIVPALPLFREEAQRAVDVINRLRLPDVEGQPLLKDALGDWFRDCVAALFGSYDAKAKERFIRELFILCPKKSSKTTGAAALMLTATLLSRRPHAEFLLVAPTLEVADTAFRQVLGMIEADPVLSAKFHVQEHLKRVTFRQTGAFLKVKSFDPKIVTGTKPAGVLLDELHVIAEQHDADRVIGQLRGGLISQPEGFLVTITTQSERPPAGVFKSELQKARAVRDGTLKAPILPVLYEFPPDVDWQDPANWAMVTPNNGRSVNVDRLVPDFEAAKEGGETELRRWASQHLNVEIGLALRSDRWAGADYWERAAQPGSLSLTELLRRSEVVTVGIDGGGLDDLLGLAVIGREVGTGRWLVWTKAWCSPLVLERRKSEASRLRDFERDGDLSIVDKLPDDVQQLVEVVVMCHQSGLLSQIGLDPARVGVIKAAIEAAEVPAELLIGISQGWRLMSAIVQVERKLAAGELVHGGSALMAWCVSNARVEQMKNAFIVTKAASGTAKIDPLMALFCAGELMGLNPEAPGRSWWDVEETAEA